MCADRHSKPAVAALLHLNQLKAGGDLGRLAQHDAGRAVLLVAHGNGAFDGRSRYALAGHGEVHIDLGENLGFDFCAFGLELDAAAAHRGGRV